MIRKSFIKNSFRNMAGLGLSHNLMASQGRLPFNHYDDVGFRGQRTLLFLDNYPLMRTNQVKIVQAEAEYEPEGYFIDPYLKNMSYHNPGSQPFFDSEKKLWRKIQGSRDMYAYESEDGISWRVSPQPDAKPNGGQKHPHHVFTNPIAGHISCVYYEDNPKDGFRFKALMLEGHGSSYEYALKNESYYWHPHALEAKAKGGLKHFHARKHSMIVSEDGLNWHVRRDYDWGTPPMITEEHYCLFYNHHYQDYNAVHRARWGDRRLFTSHSKNLKDWSPVEHFLTPDVLDEGRVEFHGSAIYQYDSYYIGLLWYGNYSDSLMRSGTGGPDQTHLIYSYNGKQFNRSHRQPLIPLRQKKALPIKGFWTRGMSVHKDKILIHSDSFAFDRETYPKTNSNYKTQSEARAHQKSITKKSPNVVHSLRKDGFTYIEPLGQWGECQTIWLTLFDGDITINADAGSGELYYEIGRRGWVNYEPLEGFTYKDCVPMLNLNSTNFKMCFKEKKIEELVNGDMVFIRFKLKYTRLYSIKGDFSTDPTNHYRYKHGMPLRNTSWIL